MIIHARVFKLKFEIYVCPYCAKVNVDMAFRNPSHLVVLIAPIVDEIGNGDIDGNGVVRTCRIRFNHPLEQ